MARQDTAKQLLEHLGGASNITSFMHCATRLRISVADDSKVKISDIKKTPGVMGVNVQKGQVHIIIGTGVGRVYDEMSELMGSQTEKEVTAKNGEKKDLFSRGFEVLSGIFTPTIPAIAGTALVSSLLSLLRTFHIIETDSATYQIINIIVKSAFYFMPMLLAWSSAKTFKTNITLALVLVGALLHPTFIGFSDAGEVIRFLGIPFKPINYNSSVLPAILSVWAMSYVYRFVNKHTPDVLKVLMVPTVTLLIMVPLSYIVLAPIGYYAGLAVSYPIQYLYGTIPALAGIIMGGFRPFLVITGMHKVFTPIVLQNLASQGYDYMLPSMMMSTMAQAGAVFAVYFKCKKEDKPLVVSSSISAILGITEPALFGVLITRKAAMLAACIGGGIWSAILAMLHFSVKAWASSNILSLPIYVESGGLVLPVVSIAGSLVTSFILAIVFMKKEADSETESKDVLTLETDAKESQSQMEQLVVSPVSGTRIPLDEVPDDVFAKGILGNGFAVNPDDGLVKAPCGGTVSMIAETGHAVGITCANGAEILLHAGLDTVQLNGKYFETYVKAGDRVAAGTPLLKFDLEKVKEQYNPVVVVVSQNAVLKY